MALRKLVEARAIWEKGNSNSKCTNSVAVLVYPTFLKWLPNSIGVSTYPTNVGGGVMATMGSAHGGLDFLKNCGNSSVTACARGLLIGRSR